MIRNDVSEGAAAMATRMRSCASTLDLGLSARTPGLTPASAAEISAAIVYGRREVDMRLNMGGVCEASDVVAALIPAMVHVRSMMILCTDGVSPGSRRALLASLRSKTLIALVVCAEDLQLDGFEHLFVAMQHMPMLGSLTICGDMTENQALTIAGAVRGHASLKELVLYNATDPFGVHIMAQACAMSPRGADRTLTLIKCSAAATAVVPLALLNVCETTAGRLVRLERFGGATRPTFVNAGLGSIRMHKCEVDDTTTEALRVSLLEDAVLHKVNFGSGECVK